MFEKLFKGRDTIVFFDTETTGLDPKSCRIIEFAAVILRKRGIFRKKLEEIRIDEFVKLPDEETVPEKIEEITGITTETLKQHGISENALAEILCNALKGSKKPLFVAYNAQFDVSFLDEFSKRNKNFVNLRLYDHLDALTVYKSRAKYPHRLFNAIEHYNLQGTVKNSHRAIDDVLALKEVTRCMEEEKDDLALYINRFGYNPKYGVPEKVLGAKIIYAPQPYSDFTSGVYFPSKCRR